MEELLKEGFSTIAMIRLPTISDVKDFVSTTRTFSSNINVAKGKYVVDGRSILGMLSLDCSKGVFVEIISDDEEEISRFLELMKKFQ